MAYIPPVNGSRPAAIAPSAVEKANIENFKSYFRKNINNPSDSYFEGNVLRIVEMAGKFETDAELQEIAQKAFANFSAYMANPKGPIPEQTLTPIAPAKAPAKLSKRKQTELLSTIEEYFKRGDAPIPSQTLKRRTVKNDELPTAQTYRQLATELLLQHQQTSGGSPKIEELVNKYVTPIFQAPVPAAAAAPAPLRATEVHDSAKQLEKLRQENYAKEKEKNEHLDELFKDIDGYEGKIGAVDERYIAFLKNIDEALQFQAKGDLYNMLNKIAQPTHSPILEKIKEAIVAKLMNNLPVAKEAVAELLKPHVYGSEPAPENASDQQIAELIELENKRHAEYMETATKKIVCVQLALAQADLTEVE
jgi:hypothetical protein